MQINKKKIIKNISLLIVVLMVILLIIVGLKGSNFGNIKKYDTSASSTSGFASSSRSNKSVTLRGNNMANLGDFTFNLSDNRLLIADISIKYKSTNQGSSWLSDKDEIDSEILKKSAILRDTAIDTMLGDSVETADSQNMRNALKDALSNKLSSGEVEEVYFNKFIIQ